MLAVLVVLMVGVAALGSYVLLRQLDTAVATDNRSRLDSARSVFDLLRARALEEMRSQGRILVEDPRLKSTLNIQGIDEATVADILRDLSKLRGTGMLVVLTPEGRVFAESGAPELRGLDLSASGVVKKAQSSNEAGVGSWVIGNKIIDLAIIAIRYDTNVISYLVVGQTVDQNLLKAVSTATGAGIGIAIGTEWAVASDDKLKGLTHLAQSSGAASQLFEADGTRYVASVIELEQMGQSRPRLVLVQSLAASTSAFSDFRWLLLLAPSVLVFIAMMLAIIVTGSRSNYRAS
ncbi:MAG TPA: hypothetical protein VN253_26140 [Kofleriaceae bacterium]|nr:hypothetical protein [Kofleriaceae bacterium]